MRKQDKIQYQDLLIIVLTVLMSILVFSQLNTSLGLTTDNLNETIKWRGRSVFLIEGGAPFTIDLAKYYADKNNTLTYSYQAPFYMKIQLEGNNLTIFPDENSRGGQEVYIQAQRGNNRSGKDIQFFIYGELPVPKVNLTKVDKKVEDAFLTKQKVRVIIVLRDEVTNSINNLSEERNKVDGIQKKVLSKLRVAEKKTTNGSTVGFAVFDDITDIELNHKYENIPVISGELTEEGFNKLKNNPEIKEIIIDPIFNLNLDESTTQIDASNTIISINNISALELTGRNQAVCILDTGIDPHSDLVDNILEQKCFCSASNLGEGGCCPNIQTKDNNSRDDSINSHGTHVAGIIAANGNIKGVAPESDMIVVKVCDFLGRCQGSDIIAGLDYCTSLSQNHTIASISGSFSDSGEYDSNTCPDTFKESFEVARQLQITPVFASGNNFYSDGISYPACSPYTIAVGASEGINSIASFSNRGDLLDVLAPGIDITSTTRSDNYGKLSGTSQATPHVAAAVALIEQRNKILGVTKNNAEIREAFRQSGKLLGGFPFINVKAAIDLIDSISIEETAYLTTGINETGNFTSAGAPDAPTLNAPADASANVDQHRLLNLSVSDPDTNAMNVSIYADNTSTPTELIYFAQDVADGSEITYNYTTQTVGASSLFNDPSLVGYWDMDKNGTDRSPQANNLTFTNEAFINTTGGKLGGALEVDGVSDKGQTKNNFAISGNTNRTVSFWIRQRTTGSNKGEVISWGGDGSGDFFRIIVYANGAPSNANKIQWAGGSTSRFWTFNNNLNEWYHIVMMMNGSKSDSLHTWANGQKLAVASTDADQGITTDASTLNIGAKADNSWEIDGYVDDVAIWNRSLTEPEIETLHRLQNDTYYWKATATDAAGSTGTSSTNSFIVGAAPDTTAPGINFTNPTPGDDSSISTASVKINISIKETSLSSVTYNWNGTNYSYYNDSLILKYNFDNISDLGESSSTVKDVSNAGNHGTWNGDGTPDADSGPTSSGKHNGAFMLDGTGDYLNAGGNVNVTVPYSFSTWLKVDDLSRVQWVFGSKDHTDYYGFWVYLNTDGTIHTSYGDGGNPSSGSRQTKVSTSAITTGSWYHITTVTRGGDDQSIYINGVDADGTYSGTGGALSQGNGLAAKVGYSSWGTYDFTGTMDELQIFDYDLTTAEVNHLYRSNLQKFNSSQWYLYVNQSENVTRALDPTKKYTYQAFASDTGSYMNSTEQRTVGDHSPPNIDFTGQTPANASTQAAGNVEINTSISATDLNFVTYNWNGTNYTWYNDSLVLMYNFDNSSNLGENNSLVVDASKGGNNGTVYGDRDEINITGAGRYGGGLKLDGNGDYVDGGLLTDVTTGEDISISVWVYNQNTAENKGIVGRWASNKGFVLFQNDLGGSEKTKVSWQIDAYGSGDRAETPANALPLNEWTHIVAVFDSGDTAEELKIYINGKLNATDNIGETHQVPSGKSLDIGAYSATTRFLGLIDEVRIWDRVVSAAEANQLYMSNLQKFNTSQWYLYVNQSTNSTNILPDGDYTYQAYASDANENINSTAQRSITIGAVAADTIPPNVTITVPASNSFQKSNFTLNATVVDGATVSSVKFRYENNTNNGSWYSMSNHAGNKWNGTFNISDVTDGNYHFRVNATDNSNNNNDTERITNVGIDTTLPASLSYVSPTSAAGLNTTTTSYTVNLTFTETSADSCLLDVGGTNYTMSLTVGGETYCNTTLTSQIDGVHTYKVWVNDTANNLVGSSSRTLTIDTKTPNMTLTAPADGLESVTSTVDLTATINDTNLRNVTLLINGSINTTNSSRINDEYNFTLDFANGHHNWTIRAQDYTGNLNESSRLLIVSADITAPSMSYVSPTRDNDSNTSFPYVRVNASIVEQNLEKVVFAWNGTNYTISNGSLVALWTFDNRSILNNNASHTSEDFRWKYNATFNGSSSFINLTGGKYDGGLQLEGSGDYASVIDSTGLDGGKELTAMLWAKTSDNDAGYMDIISKFGAADADRSWQIRHRNTSGAGERFNVIIYSADGKQDADIEPIYDRSSLLDGNWHHVAFTLSFNNGSVITYYDGEPIGNSNVLNTSSTLRTVSYPVTIGGVSATASFNGTLDQVKIFNTSLSAAEIKQHYHTNLYRFNVTQWYLYVNQSVNSTHSLVDGTYTYDTFSGDFSGNQNTLSRRTITTETVAPTSLTYVSPTSADGLNTTTTSYTVNLTFTEANPRNCILDVTTLGVGTNYTMSLTNGGATYCNDTLSSQNDGVHTYKVWVNDTAGAVVGSSSRSLTIDTKTPNMTLTGPADGATHTVATVDLNATINDTNLKNVTLLINGTFNRSNTTGLNDEYNFTLDFVDGHYNWTLRAYDFAGNVNESSRVLIVSTSSNTPTAVNFTTAHGSTDFSSESNLSSVTNMILASPNARIRWQNKTNASNQNFDKHIKFRSGFLTINSSALNANINSTANITINNVSCSDPRITYIKNITGSKEILLAQGEECTPYTVPACTSIQCSGTQINFTTSGFSGFAGGGNANLTIDNNGTNAKYKNITFNASYINSTDGTFITSAECNITFSDLTGPFTMSEAVNRYEYNKSFNLSGIKTYNVTCDHSQYTKLKANDTVTVTNSIPTSPVLINITNGTTTIDRTPNLTWNSSTDENNDTLTYQLQLDDNSDFSSMIINVSNIAHSVTNTSHTNDTILPVDTPLFWRVRAFDGEDYSDYTPATNFTVDSYISIAFSVGIINFTNMTLGENNDTSDDTPPALVLVNKGNIRVNATVYATRLFPAYTPPSEHHQFKFRANESNSFDSSQSTTTYKNLSLTNAQKELFDLGWEDVNDSVKLDINVTVPTNETAGVNLNSTITVETQ